MQSALASHGWHPSGTGRAQASRAAENERAERLSAGIVAPEAARAGESAELACVGMEHILNWISDLDVAWWPFLHLRPPQDRPITSVRVAFLAILYGMFAGMFANAVLALLGQAKYANPLLFPVSAIVAFFVVFRFTFAIAWNRRAARLVRARELSSPWLRTNVDADED
jgi:hypothetical protein